MRDLAMRFRALQDDCDRKRFSKSAFSTVCMWIVKPRSLVARSVMAGIAVIGGWI